MNVSNASHYVLWQTFPAAVTFSPHFVTFTTKLKPIMQIWDTHALSTPHNKSNVASTIICQ